MRIVFALTYYRPHVSGLTMYVQRLAEKLAANGHDVTVLTSQYDSSLPKRDELNGVKIVRCWVAFRVSKGVIMPGYFTTALSLMRQSDVVVVNLPNTPIEAFVVPFLARFIVRKPITATYHSDVHLPPTFFNKIVDKIVFLSNYLAASMVHRISAYTQDFARHSHILSRFLRKIQVIPPPVLVEDASDAEVQAFVEKHAPNGEKLIGFTARFATEKGVEHMVDALEQIHKTNPNVKVLFAGEYQNVIGEDAYWQKLQPQLTRLGASWTFLGLLNNKQLGVYYRGCDVTVLPSINSTETFGLVQVESMLCGTPVVASNLPGVRQPITRTGMGEVVPIANSRALAEAVLKVLTNPEYYIKPRTDIEAIFGIQNTLSGYERFFAEVIAAHNGSLAIETPKE